MTEHQKHQLCHLTDIEDGKAKSFIIDGEAIFVVKLGPNLHGYRNQCPHMGIPLEWGNDDFMNHDGEYIQCSMHGALFERHTGICIWGPCNGQQLPPLTIEVANGDIYWLRHG